MSGRTTAAAAPHDEAASRELPRRHIVLDCDRSIALAQTGTGPDCLLIHGSLVTLEDMWLGLASALANNFKVTAVDRPGHGYSRRQRVVDASPWRQAALIHDAATRAGLRSPIVVGHSYGATVALAYAMLFSQETAGVVALAPMCFPEMRLEAVLFGPRAWPVIGDGMAQSAAIAGDQLMLPLLWQAMYLPQVMPRTVAESLPFALAVGAGHTVVEGEDALALPSALVPMAAGYASCRVPIHILGGDRDAVVANAAQGAMAAALMPAGRFTYAAGIGHMLHHFKPELVRDACRKLSTQANVAPALMI